MPASCCVRDCKSGGSEFEYFRFPKDETHKVKWVRAIRQNNGDNFVATDHSRICHAHFTSDDFHQLSNFEMITHKVTPSIFNRPKSVVQNVKRKRLLTDAKPVQKSYDYLSEHNYVLKLPDVPSADSDDADSELTIDPSTCLVQTLKVGKHFIHDPYAFNVPPPKQLFSENDENPIIDLTLDSDDDSDNTEILDKKSFKNWKAIVISNSVVIKNLKKKVKCLQLKVRRQDTTIGSLKNCLKSYYCH